MNKPASPDKPRVRMGHIYHSEHTDYTPTGRRRIRMWVPRTVWGRGGKAGEGAEIVLSSVFQSRRPLPQSNMSYLLQQLRIRFQIRMKHPDIIPRVQKACAEFAIAISLSPSALSHRVSRGRSLQPAGRQGQGLCKTAASAAAAAAGLGSEPLKAFAHRRLAALRQPCHVWWRWL